MSSDADHDPHRRESPAGHILKGDSTEAIAQATKQEKTAAEGTPGQGIPRQNDVRASNHVTRSHKSIRRLTGSPRLDSRQDVYRCLAAWEGQNHE
jgi:hypothetical protein